jgi:hypothetical protein
MEIGSHITRRKVRNKKGKKKKKEENSKTKERVMQEKDNLLMKIPITTSISMLLDLNTKEFM